MESIKVVTGEPGLRVARALFLPAEALPAAEAAAAAAAASAAGGWGRPQKLSPRHTTPFDS